MPNYNGGRIPFPFFPFSTLHAKDLIPFSDFENKFLHQISPWSSGFLPRKFPDISIWCLAGLSNSTLLQLNAWLSLWHLHNFLLYSFPHLHRHHHQTLDVKAWKPLLIPPCSLSVLQFQSSNPPNKDILNICFLPQPLHPLNAVTITWLNFWNNSKMDSLLLQYITHTISRLSF